MSFPATIRAAVDRHAISRVTRLFNGTLADVLHELFQNSRRAGATRVEVETIGDDTGRILIVRDDGRGIDDPAALLALGRSGWDDTIAASEDPAGMGFFSLAGRDVEIRSRAPGAAQGWRVAVPAHAWEGGVSLPLEPCAIAGGTEIRIALPDSWVHAVTSEVQAAALFYPLPVLLDGSPCRRRDFLHGAVAIEEACGCRIGVFRDNAPGTHRLNFHGLLVECRLPNVGEVDHPLRWSVAIDIVDAPVVKLVLPARKEVVENAAVADLRVAAERAIYRAIGEERTHRLPFAAWTRARDLGVELPPAEAGLPIWVPTTAEGWKRLHPPLIVGEPVFIVPVLEPGVAQAAASLLRKPGFIAARPVEEQKAFAGYAWYDALPRIDEAAVLIHTGGDVHRYEDESDRPFGMAPGATDDLALTFTLHHGSVTAAPEVHSLPIDALVCDGDVYDFDDALILLRRGADLACGRLADQIEATLFRVDVDPESDSAETQRDRFRREARAKAVELLQGREAAHLDRVRSAFCDEVHWLIPAGKAVTITSGPAGTIVEWLADPAGG